MGLELIIFITKLFMFSLENVQKLCEDPSQFHVAQYDVSKCLCLTNVKTQRYSVYCDMKKRKQKILTKNNVFAL